MPSPGQSGTSPLAHLEAPTAGPDRPGQRTGGAILGQHSDRYRFPIAPAPRIAAHEGEPGSNASMLDSARKQREAARWPSYGGVARSTPSAGDCGESFQETSQRNRSPVIRVAGESITGEWIKYVAASVTMVRRRSEPAYGRRVARVDVPRIQSLGSRWICIRLVWGAGIGSRGRETKVHER